MYWREIMKKISYLELASLVIIQTVTTFFGISISILKENAGVNSWLSALISYIIGFIPLLIIIYISSYKTNLPLNKKINSYAVGLSKLSIKFFFFKLFLKFGA